MKNYFEDNIKIDNQILESLHVPYLVIPFINIFESHNDISDEEYRAYYAWDAEYREEIKNHIVDIINGKTKQPWKVISFELIKRIWMEYAQYKLIRHEQMERKLSQMSDLVVTNIVKLYVNTVLAGHTSEPIEDCANEGGYCFKPEGAQGKALQKPDEEIKETDPSLFPVQYIPPEFTFKVGDYDKDKECEILPFTKDEYQELSMDYIYDENWGQWRISDYAMEPLIKLANELLMEHTAEEQLILIDRVFNVVHPRGDIASLFVKGGSRVLSELAENPNLVFS